MYIILKNFLSKKDIIAINWFILFFYNFLKYIIINIKTMIWLCIMLNDFLNFILDIKTPMWKLILIMMFYLSFTFKNLYIFKFSFWYIGILHIYWYYILYIYYTLYWYIIHILFMIMFQTFDCATEIIKGRKLTRKIKMKFKLKDFLLILKKINEINFL